MRKIFSAVRILALATMTAAACILLIWLLCLVFVFSTFTVPTDSMQPGIQPGDKVLVEKVSTGARIFDIREAARGRRTKVRRTPHWRGFRRDDVLVFNFVHRDSWDTIAMNWPVYYIKRCIGAPGDTLEINNFHYIINGDTLDCYLPREVINKAMPDDSMARAERLRGYMADLSDTIDNWTVRDFGPIIIPAAGMTLPIDTVTFRRYRQIIEWETGLNVSRINSQVMLGAKPLESYTFESNYYFMGGDNALSSVDSRYWGLVPEDFIVGRAVRIIWSQRNNRVRWQRMLKGIE